MDLQKKVSKIPAHSINKLDTFELIWTAAEFEKFDLKNLKVQAKKVELTKKEKFNLEQRFNSFESPKSHGAKQLRQ